MTVSTQLRSVECPGTYDGHLQGIARGQDGSMFWSFTVHLVKTDSQGNLLRHIHVQGHHGDISCAEGVLYCAVNHGCFNREEDLDDNWIYAYSAEDLSFLWKTGIPEVAYGAGGLDVCGGRFFVVGGLPEGYGANYVYEYDQDRSFVCRHTLQSGYTFKGVQTACHAYGRWWFGCYGEPAKLIQTDESFGLYGMYVFDCSLGITGTGEDTFLIGSLRDQHPNQGKAVRGIIDEERGIVLL